MIDSPSVKTSFYNLRANVNCKWLYPSPADDGRSLIGAEISCACGERNAPFSPTLTSQK